LTIKQRSNRSLYTQKDSFEAVDTAELDRVLGYAMRRALQSAQKDFDRTMAPLDVRAGQYAVLLAIRENPGFTQSAISLALGIQRANFVSLLDELEERGWVERRASPKDRRSFALHLTKQGEEFVKQAAVAHAEAVRTMTQRLGPQDTKLLLQLLNRFSDAD